MAQIKCVLENSTLDGFDEEISPHWPLVGRIVVLHYVWSGWVLYNSDRKGKSIPKMFHTIHWSMKETVYNFSNNHEQFLILNCTSSPANHRHTNKRLKGTVEIDFPLSFLTSLGKIKKKNKQSVPINLVTSMFLFCFCCTIQTWGFRSH